MSRKFTLNVKYTRAAKPVVGVIDLSGDGMATFFKGDGNSVSDIVASLSRARVEVIAANGMRISGFEPAGFDRTGRPKYRHQEWWLAYQEDQTNE